MESWRLLDLEYSDPYLNMAVEEAILIAADKRLSSNTIRFWRNPRSVILGRFQDVFCEVKLKICDKYGIEVVRRFTGGGAVYHDYGNLNWTIVVDKKHPLVPKIPTEIYEVVSKAVIEGIRFLGINANFKSPNAIQVRGRKISGLASYIKKNAILCHGTLLVNSNLSVLSEVLSRPRAEVTTLHHELNKYIPMSLMKGLILLGFSKLYGIVPKLEKLNNYEERIAQILYYKKYVTKEWNSGANLNMYL
ncbi:lipoate--protein ligase family protein [Candidatus Bathyarchaeota archaeon]|nr:lipoate--protein ligase family protein [Candidatus Bathyarchaeota archaeon]